MLERGSLKLLLRAEIHRTAEAYSLAKSKLTPQEVEAMDHLHSTYARILQNVPRTVAVNMGTLIWEVVSRVEPAGRKAFDKMATDANNILTTHGN